MDMSFAPETWLGMVRYDYRDTRGHYHPLLHQLFTHVDVYMNDWRADLCVVSGFVRSARHCHPEIDGNSSFKRTLQYVHSLAVSLVHGVSLHLLRILCD